MFQGLDSQQTKYTRDYGTVKRRDRAAQGGVDKAQYRCSLINIENSQDDELDAILGELSELETKFSKEMTGERGDEGGRKRSSDESGQGNFVICEICDGYIKDLEQLRNHMQWIRKVIGRHMHHHGSHTPIIRLRCPPR